VDARRSERITFQSLVFSWGSDGHQPRRMPLKTLSIIIGNARDDSGFFLSSSLSDFGCMTSVPG